MKKIITFIALIALTATATAQVKFGVRGGYTLSPVSKSIHTDRYENQAHSESASSCGSAYAGLTAEIPASEKLLFDVGLIYINQVTIGEGSTMLHNVNLPIAVKYDISGFRPKVGGYVSYIPGVTSFENKYRSLTRKDIEKFDYGALFGLEYNFNEKLFIETNFYLGLANLLTKDPRHSSDYLRTRSILIGVGYRF